MAAPEPGPNGAALQQEITGLRQKVIRLLQENTALRQKVTMLAQKLAQQRAVAQPGQQAADLPNGKIAQAEAQKNQAPPPTHRLQIQHGTPKEAGQAIEAVWERVDEKGRLVLGRFATSPVMLTDVWPKLPRDKEILECVLLSAIVARGILPTKQPQPQSVAAFKRWAGFWLDGDQWPRRRNASELLLETCESVAIKLAYASPRAAGSIVPGGQASTTEIQIAASASSSSAGGAGRAPSKETGTTARSARDFRGIGEPFPSQRTTPKRACAPPDCKALLHTSSTLSRIVARAKRP